MKKILALFFVLAFIFTGCNVVDEIEQKEELHKLCKIKVLTAEENTLLATIDDQKIVDQFLDTNEWTATNEISKELTPQYKLVVYQEKTLLRDQDPNEKREYELIETITTYQDSSYMQVAINPDVIKNGKVPSEFLTFYYLAPDEIIKDLQQLV